MDKKNFKIRKAARAVVFDDENKIAVLDVKKGSYHKIPGGGIKDGEDIIDAVKREVMEEAGCEIDIIRDIGESEFICPDNDNLIHHSICFLAKKVNAHDRQYFTAQELENEFKLKWLTFEDAIELFENPKEITQFETEMNNRDMQFVKMAKEILINL